MDLGDVTIRGSRSGWPSLAAALCKRSESAKTRARKPRSTIWFLNIYFRSTPNDRNDGNFVSSARHLDLRMFHARRSTSQTCWLFVISRSHFHTRLGYVLRSVLGHAYSFFKNPLCTPVFIRLLNVDACPTMRTDHCQCPFITRK